MEGWCLSYQCLIYSVSMHNIVYYDGIILYIMMEDNLSHVFIEYVLDFRI